MGSLSEGVRLACGPEDDRAAHGWVRLNVGPRRSVLDEILDRVAAARGSRA